MMPDHPTAAFIDLAALTHNLQQILKYLDGRSRIIAVVKANAYGHGIVPVTQALESAGVEFFGVAFVEEGVQLRHAGIRGSILVMGGFMPDHAPLMLENRLRPVLFHKDHLAWLATVGEATTEPLPVHIKLDTGMGRLGLSAQEILPFSKKLVGMKGLYLEGLMSHFSDDDLKNGQSAENQIRQFQKTYAELKAMGIVVPQLHIANSGALLSLKESWFGWVRPGLALYGYAPSRSLDDTLPLRPVLSLKSRISHLRKVPSGTSISYGQTYVTGRDSVIAVVPIGYADGYPRSLSSKGAVLIKGKRASILGRVCMDMMVVDVTDIPGVNITEEVVLLGGQGRENINAVDLAEWAGTISYDILSAIGRRIPRIYTNNRGN